MANKIPGWAVGAAWVCFLPLIPVLVKRPVTRPHPEGLSIRNYDVRDLVAGRWDNTCTGVQIGLPKETIPGVPEVQIQFPKGPAFDRKFTEGEFLSLAGVALFGRRTDGTDLSFLSPGRLRVVTIPSLHRVIEVRLQQIRSRRSLLVSLQFRAITAPEGFFREGAAAGAGVPCLDDFEVEKILRAAQKNPLVRLCTAPNVIVYNGQKTRIVAVANPVREAAGENGGGLPLPISERAFSEFRLDLVPTIGADRRTVFLEFSPSFVSAIPRRDGESGPPERGGTFSAGSPFAIPDGGTIAVKLPPCDDVFPGAPGGEGDRSLLILLKAKIIILEEEEPL